MDVFDFYESYLKDIIIDFNKQLGDLKMKNFLDSEGVVGRNVYLLKPYILLE